MPLFTWSGFGFVPSARDGLPTAKRNERLSVVVGFGSAPAIVSRIVCRAAAFRRSETRRQAGPAMLR